MFSRTCDINSHSKEGKMIQEIASPGTKKQKTSAQDQYQVVTPARVFIHANNESLISLKICSFP